MVNRNNHASTVRRNATHCVSATLLPRFVNWAMRCVALCNIEQQNHVVQPTKQISAMLASDDQLQCLARTASMNAGGSTVNLEDAMFKKFMNEVVSELACWQIESTFCGVLGACGPFKSMINQR